MSGMTEKRIMEERKQWRIDHPPGFFAKFAKNKDDSQNMMVWETGIPGREGMLVEIGVFAVQNNMDAVQIHQHMHIIFLKFEPFYRN